MCTKANTRGWTSSGCKVVEADLERINEIEQMPRQHRAAVRAHVGVPCCPAGTTPLFTVDGPHQIHTKLLGHATQPSLYGDLRFVIRGGDGGVREVVSRARRHWWEDELTQGHCA
jgi:hypothetical protein